MTLNGQPLYIKHNTTVNTFSGGVGVRSGICLTHSGTPMKF